jgi:hypothetical protein
MSVELVDIHHDLPIPGFKRFGISVSQLFFRRHAVGELFENDVCLNGCHTAD